MAVTPEVENAVAAAIGSYARYVHAWAHRKEFWSGQYDHGVECDHGLIRSTVTEFSPAEHAFDRIREICKLVEEDRRDPDIPALDREKSLLETLMLIVTEVAEIADAAEFGDSSERLPGFTELEEEVADTVIRLFDFAQAYGVRLGSAVIEKMRYNETRPPKHGKRY